jgi:ribosome-associated translation inhibitor RaiA
MTAFNRTYVYAEFKRIGRHDTERGAFAQRALNLSPLERQKTAAVTANLARKTIRAAASVRIAVRISTRLRERAKNIVEIALLR